MLIGWRISRRGFLDRYMYGVGIAVLRPLLLMLICIGPHQAVALATQAALDTAIEQHMAPYAEFKHIQISNYTSDQTNIGSITAMVQDTKGFLWVGGENGLARYDGHNVLLYRADNHNSIAGNYVQSLAVDERYVWVATVTGISRFDLNSGVFTNISSATNTLPSNDVTSITRYKNWIFAGTTEGLSVLDADTLKQQTPAFIRKLPALIHIRYVYVYDDELWLGTSHLGLIRVNLLTDEVSYYSPDPKDPKAIAHQDVRGIYSPDGVHYWLASLGGGLILFDSIQKKFTQYAAHASADKPFVTNDVWGVFGDSKGYIWVGTDSAGLWRVNLKTQKIEGYIHDSSVPASIDSNKARLAFEDKDHNIWVGSFSGTLNYYYRGFDQIKHFRKRNRFHKGLNDNAILSIHPAQNGLYWVGTEGGLDLLDPHQGSVTSFSADTGATLKANPVLALETDSQGYLWVGTWGGGVQRYNPKNGQWLSLMNHPDPTKRISNAYIWALKDDGKGNLWVGTQKRGLFKLHLATGNIKHYPFNAMDAGGIVGEFVRDITLDKHGNVWVASLHGLSRYRPESDDFDITTHDPNNTNSLSSNQLIAITAHSNGDMWFASRSSGISVYSPSTKTYRHLSVKEGLPSPAVSCIVEDTLGDVWAGTPSGLVRISADFSQVHVYRQANGLAGSNYNRNACYVDPQGQVWAGSKEGLSIFEPVILEQTQKASHTVLSGLRINYSQAQANTYWQTQTQLPQALHYQQNSVSFEFSLNQFHLPQFNEYRYRLQGFDTAWQNINRGNSAIYTNLDPGQYTFEVKGKSANGQWGDTTTAIRFSINPPPWRQWWAYLLYASFITVAFAAYRNYMAVRARSLVYQQLSQQDQLTELPNRLALNHRIDDWLKAGKSFSVIIIDLDFFKKINDTYGHEAGDVILKAFAKIAQSEIRDCDLLGRWGGEEFLVLCDSSNLGTVKNIAERIQKNVAMQSFLYYHQTIELTISAGCAVRELEENFTELFHRADQALYFAKEGGRNCVMAA